MAFVRSPTFRLDWSNRLRLSCRHRERVVRKAKAKDDPVEDLPDFELECWSGHYHRKVDGSDLLFPVQSNRLFHLISYIQLMLPKRPIGKCSTVFSCSSCVFCASIQRKVRDLLISFHYGITNRMCKILTRSCYPPLLIFRGSNCISAIERQ